MGNALFLSRRIRLLAGAAGLAICSVLPAQQAGAITLRESVAVAVESNPEIGQAIENREAIEFELRQARGLYLPSIDLEASAGARRLDNPSRRRLGIDGDGLSPVELQLTATQKLFDGGGRRAERDRQASRVDSASFRVLERSEYIGLQVVREYLEYLLQQRIVRETARNLDFHRGIQGNISAAIRNGTLTEADRQQVRERVLAAEARLKEAEEELAQAGNRFLALVGKPLTNPKMPGSVASHLPSTLDEAIGSGRKNNPRVHMAMADIDAADAMVDAARSKLYPEVFLEGRGRVGHDIDGADGRTNDFQARVVAKWNLYRGGIDKANEQEQVRRASEQRLVLHQVHRELELAVRESWDRRFHQASLAQTLRAQANENNRLVSSYREQFNVGRRSLLDVLDAQNTRYNVDVLAATAEYAALFAEYRLLAASGLLLKTLKVAPQAQAEAYARTEFNVPPTAPTETYARVPSRQTNSLPMDLLAPIRK